MSIENQECSRCVLSSFDDPDIFFNKNGVCNHCLGYELKINELPKSHKEKLSYIEKKIDEIKKHGKGREYDCILGLSGGVDSSYLSLITKEYGLRPLLVHFDNGWNSELAVNNIDHIVSRLGFNLYTYVVNWNEFKDLQLSYIKSGVLDWEIPTDHGFYAMMYHQAHKRKIKYILSGHNLVTEGILPKCMRWSKLDVANISDIHSKFGTKKLKTFPTLPFYKSIYFSKILKIELVSPLNYFEYDKNKAKQAIIEKLGWRDYGGKHYESIFTRFYQGYVLVEKYGFDKRKAHLSTLINSGQISKENAIKQLRKPDYNFKQINDDKEYVLKKLGLSELEFKKIMNENPVNHLNFKSYETGIYRKHEKFMKKIKPITRLLKKIV